MPALSTRLGFRWVFAEQRWAGLLVTKKQTNEAVRNKVKPEEDFKKNPVNVAL